MTAFNFEVTTFILCDDIRQERNGNYIILSPRTSATKSDTFPVDIEQTFAYIEINTKGKIINGFNLGIFNELGDLLSESKTFFSLEDWNLPAGLAVRLPSFKVTEAGCFICKIKEPAQSDWHEIYRFYVNKSQTNEVALPKIPIERTDEFRRYMADAARAFMDDLGDAQPKI